jgi:hypothetical protein
MNGSKLYLTSISETGQKRRFKELGPNGLFLIRKRTLGDAPVKVRSWPIPAIWRLGCL